MQRLKSSITAVKEGGEGGGEGERGKGENRKGEMGEGGGKGGKWGRGRHSTDSSICERNLKCTQYDARHCLTHIFTEVSIDCQL